MARTFPILCPPGEMVRRLVPSDCIVPSMLFWAHSPMARSTTTEKTHITIPSDESPLLSLLTSIFFIAVFVVRMIFIGCSRIAGW